MKNAPDNLDLKSVLTSHARRRTTERGIRRDDLALLLFAADREVPVGRARVAISISGRRRKELIAEGFTATEVERAARVVAVEGPGGTIVTVLRPGGARGRRYRRDWNSGRHGAKLRRASHP